MTSVANLAGDTITVLLGIAVALAAFAWLTALPTIGALWVMGVLR